MSLPQQKLREIVFQILYSRSVGETSMEDLIPLIMKELSVAKRYVRLAAERANTIIEKREELDSIIEKVSVAYSIERIQAVELNVLRLGVFELLYDSNIPPKVAISEAMRLTRKFSTPYAAKFVNALLDCVYKQSEGETVDKEAVVASAAELQESEEIARQAGEEDDGVTDADD